MPDHLGCGFDPRLTERSERPRVRWGLRPGRGGCGSGAEVVAAVGPLPFQGDVVLRLGGLGNERWLTRCAVLGGAVWEILALFV